MLIRFGDIAFKDYMNFSVGLSLEKFAESVGVSEKIKMAYPYEKFLTVASLKSAETFPIYDDFQNSLYTPSNTNINKMNEIIANNLSGGVWSKKGEIMEAMSITKQKFEEHWDETRNKFFVNESSRKYFQICPEKYLSSKQYFSQSCRHMLDYLSEYNLLDCRILLTSILSHARGFLEDYQVDVHQSLSLPGIAQESFFISPI